LGLNDTLKKLAAEMAEHVEVPIGTTSWFGMRR
jgi:hypothetical protein